MAEGPVESDPLPLPKLNTTTQSIRLLKARRVGQLSYDVQTFILAQCPTYKALSYTWGSPFPPDQLTNTIGQRFPSDKEFEERAFDWHAEDSIIQCNGSSVRVGQNLFEALSELSAVGEQGFIWIDRLCIDQSNTSERASQVALMSRIYSKAAAVIVWLGRGGEDSLAVLRIQTNFAGPLFDLAKEGKLSEMDLQGHNPDNESYLAEFALQITMLDTWFAWTQFFRRSWFYRRWTLQETALANHIDVLCGDQKLDWYKLKFLVRYFSVSQWRPYLQRYMRTEYQPMRALLPRTFIESVFSDLQGWKSECLNSYHSFSIGTVMVELLYRTCMLQCSDPRDMIYGILGVVESIIEQLPELRDSHPIAVDYNTNIIELYQEVIQLCLETVPDLAILSLVQDFSRRSILGLPSWVPDLYGMAGYVMEKLLGLNRRRPRTPQYNVAFYSKSIPPERFIQGSTLHLKGYRIGNLVYRSVNFDSDTTAEDTLSSILDICSALPLVLRDRQDRIQALWRTIVSDSEVLCRPAPVDLGICFRDWILKYLFLFRTTKRDWPEQLSTICEGFTKVAEQNQSNVPLPDVSVGSVWWNRLKDASSENAFQELTKYMNLDSTHRFDAAITLHNRILFRTEENDIGFGPLSSKPGDQVWVLENARVPFILRPAVKASSFAVVGECYIHGIMDGQLFAGASLDYVPLLLV